MIERVGTETAGGAGMVSRAHDLEGRPRDSIRVTVVALLPMVFLTATLLAEQLVNDYSARLGKILELSNILGIATQVVLAPFLVVSLIGAFALRRRNFRQGNWFAKVGSTATALACFLIVACVLAVATGPNPSPYEWKPLYSLPAALLALAPHLAIVSANVYIVVRLSKRRR
ncbi:hypothetical protein [Nocardia sp. NPDC051832]|uniref:hypothetical protein n=1 Tax=Nocardia sp. NPDC051832 TaxID=3155673 RepID=UPI0034380596